MPLTRASARFVMRQDDLHFLMKDGEAEVVCAISARVLLAIGKAAGITNPVFAFWGFRDRIEDAASAKYDRTVRVDYEVLTIEERDLTLSEQSAQSARPPRQ
jgi:hypothetical protein